MRALLQRLGVLPKPEVTDDILGEWVGQIWQPWNRSFHLWRNTFKADGSVELYYRYVYDDGGKASSDQIGRWTKVPNGIQIKRTTVAGSRAADANMQLLELNPNRLVYMSDGEKFVAHRPDANFEQLWDEVFNLGWEGVKKRQNR